MWKEIRVDEPPADGQHQDDHNGEGGDAGMVDLGLVLQLGLIVAAINVIIVAILVVVVIVVVPVVVVVVVDVVRGVLAASRDVLVAVLGQLTLGRITLYMDLIVLAVTLQPSLFISVEAV